MERAKVVSRTMKILLAPTLRSCVFALAVFGIEYCEHMVWFN